MTYNPTTTTTDFTFITPATTTTESFDIRYDPRPEDRQSPPNEPVVRSVKFRAEQNGDGLTLEGFAAVFNEETVIDSMWEGHFREQIAPGAFARTLREDPSPVMQFDHGSHPLIGSIPLGRIETLEERKEGLFVRARLSDNWLIEPIRDSIRDGAVDGMSFRFRVLGESVEKGQDGELDLRTINDVELLELGPVVFPAYPQTSVGVRSKILDELRNPEVLREFARVLYGDGGEPGGSTNAPSVSTRNRAGEAITKLRLRGF